MAITGGAAGVLLTTAVLVIATPVLMSTRMPPVEGIAPHIIAIAARAPTGMSSGLVDKVVRGSGAAAVSRVVIANTTVRDGRHDFVPMVVLGVDPLLDSMLATHVVRGAPPLQPNQAYLQRGWANQHDFHAGDRLEVTTPTGIVTWRIAGLLNTVFANNGSSVVVSTATAAPDFDRGSSVDLLLLRPRGAPRLVREHAAALVDGAADVVSPNQVFASYARIYRTPLTLVAILGAVAVLVGCVVLFLTWRLALIDARPLLSRLRLLGVRSSDLLLGSGLVLVPVLVICYAIGATIGCLVGLSLSSFRNQILNFTGQAFDPSLNLTLPLAGGLAASLVMFGFAWLTGVRQLQRATVIDTIAGRDVTVFERSRVRWPLMGGLGCFGMAGLVVAFTAGALQASATVPLLLGVTILSAILPVLAGTSIRALTNGASGLLVGRQLQVEWRRNAALAITFAIALLSSIAIFGVASSTLRAINESTVRWTKGQLYVTAAPLGHNYESETFPSSVQKQIATIQGVGSTDTFSYVDAVLRGTRHLVETVGGDSGELTAPRLTSGPPDVVDGRKTLFDVLSGDDLAISSNFARTQHLRVGSTVAIPVSDGERTGRVVAVIDDSLSDGGMVMVGPQLFREVAGDSRMFYVGVRLDPGAHESAIRGRIRALLADRYPRAQVLTVSQYRAEVSSLLGRLMSSFSVFAWVMFGVAAIVGTATLASTIAERSRPVALTRLVGGKRQTIRSLLGIEAMVTVTIAWLVAVLGAQLAIPALIGGQSVFSGLLPPAQVPLSMIGISLPMAALATATALLIARRVVSEQPLAQLIADE
jgi:putative ABC transport system permease protein